MSGTEQAVVEIDGVSLNFGGVKALDDLSVSFGPGVSGLLGPNGAGKTTLFNVLSGFVSPDVGSVRMLGEDLLRMPDYRRSRRGLRRTFQQEQAIEQLTVTENVKTVLDHASGRFGKRSGLGESARKAVAFAGLEDHAEEAVGLLDSHLRRLVEIARAVAGDPVVVLMDEPAAGLSESESDQLVATIKRIPTELGAAVILIDHDIDLVVECCERIAVLEFGRLVKVGPTNEVLRDERVAEAYLGAAE